MVEKRIDHILISKNVKPLTVTTDHATLAFTDHSAVIAKLEINRNRPRKVQFADAKPERLNLMHMANRPDSNDEPHDKPTEPDYSNMPDLVSDSDSDSDSEDESDTERERPATMPGLVDINAPDSDDESDNGRTQPPTTTQLNVMQQYANLPDLISSSDEDTDDESDQTLFMDDIPALVSDSDSESEDENDLHHADDP